jgi:Zn-dependent protease/CBS domain-containing protein
MKSNLKLARIAGVELRLHYSWIAIAVLITLSLGARFHSTNPAWSSVTIWGISLVTGALFFVSLFAHELAHALVAKARGLPIHRITLFFLGGMAQIEREAADATTEFWMAIAGPLASVGAGVVCLGLARAFFAWHWPELPQHPAAAVLVWLGYINLVLAAFNLIPGYPMDGGRVLRAALWRITGDGDKATRIAARVGQGVGWLFILWGMYRVLGGDGFGALWIALIGWFLLQAAGATLLQNRTASLLHGVIVADVMSRSCAPVDGATDVQTLVTTRVAHGQRCFLVYDGGRIAGMVTAADLRRVDKSRWRETPLWRVAQPLEQIPSVTPQTPAMETLERMNRDSNSDLLVVGDGYLHGVVSRSDILRFLETQAELRAA